MSWKSRASTAMMKDLGARARYLTRTEGGLPKSPVRLRQAMPA